MYFKKKTIKEDWRLKKESVMIFKDYEVSYYNTMKFKCNPYFPLLLQFSRIYTKLCCTDMQK